MRKTVILAIVAFVILTLVSSVSHAVIVTGTYTPGGMTTGTGPWVLTSDDGPADFSFLRLTPDQSFTFADLTDLSVDFVSPLLNALTTQTPLNAGGGGGAPRLTLLLDLNANGMVDAFPIDRSMHIHLGTSPTYIDAPITLNTHSGMPLIGNNDAGRYDTSAFVGGSTFTTYSSANALIGGLQVLRMSVVLDSFSNNDKTLEVSAINAQAVPEASQIIAMSLVLALGTAVVYSRRKLLPKVA